MGNSCSGICIRYKALKTQNGHYFVGHKRCNYCEIFIKWDGDRCPCCSCKLRIRPRKKSNKESLIVSENVNT